jgi:hypothetical protein
MNWRILIIFLTISSVCYADDKKNKNISPEATLTPIVQIGINIYKFSKIKFFEGFFVNGVMYGNSPGFSISYENAVNKLNEGENISKLTKGDSPDKFDIHLKTLFTILTKASNSQRAQVRQSLNNFSSFVESNIVRSETVEREGMNLLQYDFLDSNSKVRMSVWYDEKTGFMIKRVIFGQLGNVVAFKIYYNVSINEAESKERDFNEGQLERFKRIANGHNNLPHKTIEEIDRFVKSILAEFDE